MEGPLVGVRGRALLYFCINSRYDTSFGGIAKWEYPEHARANETVN